MSSKRVSIRNFIIAKLKEEISEVSQRVFNFRDSSLWTYQTPEEYPAINVSTPNENGSPFQSGSRNRTYDRTMTLKIEVATVATEDVETVVDELCDKIESVFADDPILGGLVEEIRYIGTMSVVVQDGSMDVGGAEITFEVEYLH